MSAVVARFVLLVEPLLAYAEVAVEEFGVLLIDSVSDSSKLQR